VAARFSDQAIHDFLDEAKPLPPNFVILRSLREKRGHSEQELDIKGNNNNLFRLIVRQNSINHLDFSIILGIIPSDKIKLFRLRRYNGRSHEHTNLIENQKFYDFHIHTATERYQEIGAHEDAFAESTDRYTNYYDALQCMFMDCNFIFPNNAQRALFRVLCI
jgi:hypothetical protein